MAAANASSTSILSRSTSRSSGYHEQENCSSSSGDASGRGGVSFPGPFFKDPKVWIPRTPPGTPPQGPVPTGKDTEGKDKGSFTFSQFRSYWRRRTAEPCGSQHQLMLVGKPRRKVQKSEGSLAAAETPDGIADGESVAAKTAERLSRLAGVELEAEAEQAELVEEEAEAQLAELAAFTPAVHDSEGRRGKMMRRPRKPVTK